MAAEWQIIYNPQSGSATTPEVMAALCGKIGPCELHATSEAGDARAIARQLVEQGATRILTAGGDGTLNEVLNGVAPDFDKVTLGLLPQGTGNDLARYLEIPTDLEEAVVRLKAVTQPRLFDIVRIAWGDQTHYFINASAGGFSTVVGEKLDARTKSLIGSLAFYLSAVKALPELQPYRVQLVVDHDETIEYDAYAVLVFNGRYIAGGIAGVPWSQIDDGKIDIVVVPHLPVIDLTKMLSAVLLESKLEGSLLIHRQTSCCKLTATPAFQINADGEIVADTPAKYQVLPQAVKFWV